MLGLLKRLLIRGPKPSVQNGSLSNSSSIEGRNQSSGDRGVSDRYFQLSNEIELAKAEGDYRRAIRAAQETFSILPAFVRQWKREYGSWDIAAVHAIHTAGTLMAIVGDREAIAKMRATVESVPDLHPWRSVVEDAETDAALVDAILSAVKASPGIAQSDLKQHVGTVDGRRLSTLAAWLEKGARIQRVRSTKTFLLYPIGASLPSSRTAAEVAVANSDPSHTQGAVVLRSRPPRAALRAREIDFGTIQYVRLPKAPMKWEERQRQDRMRGDEVRGERPTFRAETRFSVDGAGWQLQGEEKLPVGERPHPAYREVFPTSGATFWLDPKARREGFENAVSALRVTNRAGELLAERGLGNDVYRADVNAQGSGILFLSREGVLHGYSDRLDQFIAERVEDLPEYRAQAERFGIMPNQLKNHTRCVALSADRSRYLLTIVDEAWCLSTVSGDILWGLRLPTKEGWTRVVRTRSDRTGTDTEIRAALRVMELELPVTPADITRQYRKLAMRWHPDRNPDDHDATRKFQALVAAMELLTGAELGEIGSQQTEEVTYERILGRHRIDVPMEGAPGGSLGVVVSISMGIPESFASDWIYAANFGSTDDRVYLAGYSGTVLEVSSDGRPLRAYDIGAVPRRLAESGKHLYLLTDTRLYVLSGDGLEAVVDVFDKGELVVGDTGFGLLQPKSFTWFSPSGGYIGEVRSRDPIRRVFSAPRGLVAETRLYRVVVNGAPAWWSEGAS